MAGVSETLENYSIKINDYNPNAFCLIQVELNEEGRPEDWTYLYCNDALARIAGKPKNELEGNRFFDVFPDGSRKWLGYYYKAAYEGNPVSFYDFSKEVNQWLHIDVYPIGKQGFCTCTIFDIDKDTYDKQKNKEQFQEQLFIFDALADSYANVYLINPALKSLRVLKSSGYTVTGTDQDSEKYLPYEAVKSRYVSERVHPEDADMMQEAISLERVMKELAASTEYSGKYRILSEGETHYYQFRFIKLKDFEYVIACFWCVDHNVKEYLDQQRKENENMAIINTLSGSFKNVFIANLNKGTAKVVRLADGYDVKAVMDVMDEEFPFDAVIKRWLNENVHPDDKDRVAKMLDFDNLRRVFSEQDEYVGTYRSTEGGELHYYQFDFRKMDDKGNIVAGFQIIDHMIEEQEAKEKREKELTDAYLRDEKEHTDIIKSLSNIYSTIIKVEIDTHRYEIFNSVSLMKSVAGSVGNFDDTKESILSAFMAPDMQEQMRAFLDFETLADRLKDVNTIAIDYQAPSGQWVQARFVVKRRDENGVAREALYVVRDVSEEKAKEQERLKKERELEELHLKEEREHAEVVNSLSTIYSTIFRADIDTHEYEILGSVPLMGKVASTIGNFDDVKEKIIENFMEPEFRESLSEFLDLNTLADRLEKVNTVTTDYKAPTGQWMQARFITKRRDEDGRAREILYVARDITAEKVRDFEQQENLTHALAAAQQANKAKTTFLNSMSHDIRTPMNAIIGFTALAQTHIDEPAQVKDYLGKISTSSAHLLSLINDILDMSRIESGTVKLDEKAVHIPDILHDLRIMIQGMVNSRNLNLFIDTQDVVHENVLTDKLRLNQVLLNIVSNAVKFTQPGGDIIIRLIERPCSRKHYTTYEFSVKDNGIGMSQEFLGHIFETFTREHSSTVSGIQGTGLGMAITKNIVDMMGGDIRVESKEGKGSLFTVTLNLRLTDETVKKEPIPALLGARVLIVDDDISTCRSLSKMLRDIQMRPDWTVSGKEAVLRAQDAAEINDEYSVYIIDYLMPDMNGIETVRRIRRVISEEAPIIVLTAYDWAGFEDEAREAGVTAFVSKPIFMSELRDVLTQPVVGEKITKEEKKKKDYDYSDKRVLLVEDNELNREIATAILEEIGMTVDSVNDGDVAVAAVIDAPADKYDIILMDIQMPKMDGYMATKEIRTLQNNKKANIPIVAMTANVFEEDKRKAYDSGMNGHIIKPISIDAIVNMLNEIFA